MFLNVTITLNEMSQEEVEEDESYNISLKDRKIQTQPSDTPISNLCDRMTKGRLTVQAEFQRDYVWETKAELKSKLIESVLLKVPIPVVYTAEMNDGKEVVVDGQQRLKTFFEFRKPDGFKLSKLKILDELNGKSYAELSEEDQTKFDEYPIRVVKILKESHPDIKYDIFERLNRGSVKLNDQELRNCVYRGNFNDLLRKLVTNQDFLKIQKLTEPNKRMKDVERILRFFALVDRGIQNYKSPLRTFLSSYMEEKMNISEKEIQEKTDQFKKCAELCKTVFGDLAGFRWVKDEDDNSGYVATNFNDAVLDAQMIGFIEYSKRDVMPKASMIKDAYIDLVSTPSFSETVQIATYDTKKTKRRMEKWLTKLREIMDYLSDDRRLYTFEEKKRLFEQKDGNICKICKNQIMDINDAHVDHIERFVDGGETTLKNAQLTHRYCNLQKG